MLFGGFIVVFIFLWLVSEVIVDSFLLFLLFVRILLLVWLAASLHHDWTFVNWSCLFVVHYLVVWFAFTLHVCRRHVILSYLLDSRFGWANLWVESKLVCCFLSLNQVSIPVFSLVLVQVLIHSPFVKVGHWVVRKSHAFNVECRLERCTFKVFVFDRLSKLFLMLVVLLSISVHDLRPWDIWLHLTSLVKLSALMVDLRLVSKSSFFFDPLLV